MKHKNTNIGYYILHITYINYIGFPIPLGGLAFSKAFAITRLALWFCHEAAHALILDRSHKVTLNRQYQKPTIPPKGIGRPP